MALGFLALVMSMTRLLLGLSATGSMPSGQTFQSVRPEPVATIAVFGSIGYLYGIWKPSRPAAVTGALLMIGYSAVTIVSLSSSYAFLTIGVLMLLLSVTASGERR